MAFSFSETDILCVDLDDTILDFDGGSAPSWKEACADCEAKTGFPAPVLHAEINAVAHRYWSDPERHRAGRLRLDQTRRELVRQAFSNLGLERLEDADSLAAEFTALREGRIRPFEGAVEALEMLSLRIPLVLVTNGESHKQRWKIERFGLSRYFREILVEEELGFGKPDTRVFEHACNLTKVSPRRCAMIGDNLSWDVEAPQKIGMKGIWNDVRGTGLPPDSPVRPDHIVRSLSELAEALR